MLPVALVLLGYLAGSIPFGVLLTHWLAGKDVRAEGSGNIGATNVARVAGKKLGLLVLALDAAKGALVLFFALRLFPESLRLHAAVGLAAVLGHVFPIWLGLKGGKGVATALGVMMLLAPWAALAGAGVWLALYLAFRVSSLGSLGGGAAAAAMAFLLGRPLEYCLLLAALFLLLLFTHRGNISRLRRGMERKL